jgi:hypothetical protein
MQVLYICLAFPSFTIGHLNSHCWKSDQHTGQAEA